jgi:hypothetical protein
MEAEGEFWAIPQGWLALVGARELVVEREGKEGVSRRFWIVEVLESGGVTIPQMVCEPFLLE